MKLNIKGCQRYCEQKGITNYVELAHVLELSVVVVRLLEQGIAIGYDAVKDNYNKLGEAAVLQIIDFGEETLSGFKSKYIQVCKRLY